MRDQKNSALGDGGDGAPVHSLSVQANLLKTKGPETVSLRDEIAKIIDPWAFKQSEWAAAADNDEALRRYLPERETAHAKADSILSLLPPKGWRPIESARKEDGESILASATGKVWFQATWDAEAERWVTFNCYLENDRHQPGDGIFKPMVWMPLPAAPVTKTE